MNLFRPSALMVARAACGMFALSSLFILISATAAQAQTGAQTRPVARLISVSTQPGGGGARRVMPSAVSARSSVPAVTLPATTATAAPSMEQRVFALINQRRRAQGLRPLVWDEGLSRAARTHSQNMATQGFFDHLGRDGRSAADRARSQGVSEWQALGENIAYNLGYEDPAAFAVERWMTSQKHRDNILSAAYTHSGLGVVRGADGRVFLTQVFIGR